MAGNPMGQGMEALHIRKVIMGIRKTCWIRLKVRLIQLPLHYSDQKDVSGKPISEP